MKITFLGTGPAGRIPRPNCKWPVCEEARKPQSKSARLQTSTFFEFGDFPPKADQPRADNVLIDAGEDFKKQSELIKGKNIGAIFLTHGHIDAIGGLKQLYEFSERSKLPTVYIEKNTRDVLVGKSLWAEFPFKEIRPFEEIVFKNFSVVPLRVEHAFNLKFLTLGYLFKIGGKRIVYASDFKKIPRQSENLIKNADLAILDCAAYERPIPTHVSFPEILKLNKELAFKKVYLTQVGITWPRYELSQKIIKKQTQNIFLAYDGLKLEI